MADLNHILHVDDDEDILDLARMSLEMVGGFQVDQNIDPVKALEMVPQVNPQLLLFDVMMPDMTGPELFQNIRKLEGFEQMQVIFMTAKAQALQTDQLMSDGVLGVLAKPFEPMELPDDIRRLWSEAQ